MVKTDFLSGLTGAMGLYTGVKGLFDSASAARKQKRLIADARAEEAAWYRRNYYGDYLNGTQARAALKRVENTLRNGNRQNRAYAAVSGATPEQSLARSEQGLRSMENIMTNMAAQADAHKQNVDSVHRQNMNAFRNMQLQQLQTDEAQAGQDVSSGIKLLNDALAGLDWGREEYDNKKEQRDYEEQKNPWGW